MGMENTTGVSLDMMIEHGKAVMRAGADIPVIIDLPYGTYENSPEQALGSAVRVITETGADGVKLEGGLDMTAQIEAITKAGYTRDGPYRAPAAIRDQRRRL
jgi:3-methyl-2-oxobutanoate hydroxymethyltransferase